MIIRFALCLAALALSGAAASAAPDNAFSSLASDRTAAGVGDVVTVLVYENSTAVNSANSNLDKNSSLNGQIQAGSGFNESASLRGGSASDSSGATARSGRMVAQISVFVESVLPNGDLIVSGSQELNINGERTTIRIKGRVRLADIAANNTVLSSRLGDAKIDYDGQGFVSNSAQPGIVVRIFNWLGIP